MNEQKRITVVLTLVSMAVLCYELTQIRVFAFALHPIVAYSAIAIAMLGFGLGATWLAVRPTQPGTDFDGRIAWLSAGLAVSMVVVNVWFARTSMNTIPQGTLDVNVPWMGAVLLPCILPYFFGGMITALIFHRGVELIGRLYFWNLLGSAAGSVGMVLLLRPLGAGNLLLMSAALSVVGAVLLWRSPARRVAAGALGVLCLCGIGFSDGLFPFQPDPNGYNQLFERAEIKAGHSAPINEITQWDPIGRIDVQKHTREHIKVTEPIDYRVVTIDGGAMTLMLEEIGEPGTWGKALFGQSMYAAAYQIKKTPDVLVIGSGGGSDIETGLYWDANTVTGVEISGSTLKAVTGDYADFLGWPKRENVDVYHGDGRAFAKSTDKRFDVIQMSGVDTMTMHTAGGAMVAAEDYLYTVDAFVDFLEILKDGGLLSVMRFGDQAMNLAAIASIALRRMEIDDPQSKIVALRQANMSGILVKREGFTDDEITALERFTSRRHVNDVDIPIYDRAAVRLGAVVEMLHPRGKVPAPRYAAFFDAVAQGNEEEALAQLGHAFVTPTDDRPYYILGTFFEAMHRGEKPHPALRLLIASTVIISLASLVLILLPVFFVRRREALRPAHIFATVGFFFAIGAGFMLLEVGLIHKATVFVSTPGAAVAVVLSSILVSSGLGARFSDISKRRLTSKLIFALVGLLGVSALYKLAAGPVFDALFGLPLPARCIVAAVALSPAGFFMGWFFPTGLRVISRRYQTLVPWAIGVNGFASVIGSLVTLFLGVTFGLTGVFIIALLGYILGVLGLLPLARSAQEQ